MLGLHLLKRLPLDLFLERNRKLKLKGQKGKPPGKTTSTEDSVSTTLPSIVESDGEDATLNPECRCPFPTGPKHSETIGDADEDQCRGAYPCYRVE